jgi:hypothetical protein
MKKGPSLVERAVRQLGILQVLRESRVRLEQEKMFYIKPRKIAGIEKQISIISQAIQELENL